MAARGEWRGRPRTIALVVAVVAVLAGVVLLLTRPGDDDAPVRTSAASPTTGAPDRTTETGAAGPTVPAVAPPASPPATTASTRPVVRSGSTRNRGSTAR